MFVIEGVRSDLVCACVRVCIARVHPGVREPPLTQAVSVRGHGGQGAPALAVGVVALHRVEGLQPVAAPHHVEASVQHGHAELQPAAAHGGHLAPGVSPQAVLLDAGGPWTQNAHATGVSIAGGIVWGFNSGR